MKPGPKPKPTALRLVHGDRKDRINTREPAASKKAPRCPSWLPKEARAVWRRTVSQLSEMGVASETDTDLLATYCMAVVTFQRATEEVEREGILIEGRRDGKVKNPAVQIQRDAARAIAQIGAEFGLSPSSRSRLQRTEDEAGLDDLLD